MRIFLTSFGLELILLISIVFMIWMGTRIKKILLKRVLFNFSAILIALVLYEFVLTFNSKQKWELKSNKSYYTPNSELGYGVADSLFSVKAAKNWKQSGEEIYNVKYSFANGRRVTPGSDTLSKVYDLFLGGSFAFGEGVNDNETLPYHYNALAPERRNIRNYGFHGHGTHQVYTIAKNEIASDITLANAKEVNVYYWFISAHIPRVNGFSIWDPNGPRYILENDILKYTGTFKDQRKDRSLIIRGINFIWTNSAIYNGLVKRRLATRDKEVDLFLALVKETDLLFKRKGFNFTVLVQRSFQEDELFAAHYKDLMNRIKYSFIDNDIQYIDVDEVLQHQGVNIGSLFIQGDGHPTGELHKLLADFLWKERQTRETFNNR